MKNFTQTWLILIAIFIAIGDSLACTSAVISARATKDGKPLLWKHRDTDAEQNHMQHFRGAKYSFTALANSVENGDGAIWIGTNSTGFSIMNTASYNLKNDTIASAAEQEGMVMKMALGVCKDLKDFEKFLDTLSKPRCVQANFGVIDANGGAAYYETNNFEYFKTDANDPMVAPQGYIIRTNFSFAGRVNEGLGYIRYQSTHHLLSQAMAAGTMTPEWIFANVSRSFYNAQLETDLTNDKFAPSNGWMVDQDLIPRYESSASVIVQGVKTGQNPNLTTMWCVLGYAPCSIAVPVWEASGTALPSIMTVSDGVKHAPMCDLAVKLKHTVYPITRGSGKKYMHFALLYNKQGDGIMQTIAPIEADIFKQSRKTISTMEQEGYNKVAVDALYADITTRFNRFNNLMIERFDL